MTELVIVRGLPGSGKTTFARQWVAADRKNRARVNRDDIRAMLDDVWFIKGVTEGRVLVVRDQAITALLKRGVSVISDDTNLPNRIVRDLIRLARLAGATVAIEDMTGKDIQQVLQQNANRTDKAPIPEHVIADMYNRFVRGKASPLPVIEPVPDDYLWQPYEDPGPEFPEAIIVDVDGTLALKGTRDPFDESRVHEDRPNPSVVRKVQDELNAGTVVIVLSGRTDGCKTSTQHWLADNVGGYDALWMRKAGDTRKDSIVKYELFDKHVRGKYRIKYVLDDRNQVVAMWRALGLPCWQVAPGDF